jgi:RNA polymerase sigma-70 factor (ECF subfamily)
MDGIECGLSLYGFEMPWSGRVEEPSGPKSETPRPRHFNSLLRQARHMGLSVEDGEDIAQEALLRLHLYGRENAVSSEEGFLRRTVHNLVVDRFRRSRPDLWRHVSVEDLEDVLLSNVPDPERIVMGEDALSELWRRIAASVPGAEDIFVAHQAGWTVADIAKALPISAITVKRRLAKVPPACRI